MNNVEKKQTLYSELQGLWLADNRLEVGNDVEFGTVGDCNISGYLGLESSDLDHLSYEDAVVIDISPDCITVNFEDEDYDISFTMIASIKRNMTRFIDIGDYFLKITKDGIECGCQYISNEKFDEIVSAVNSVRQMI